MRAFSAKRIFIRLIMTLMCLFCAIMLCACNPQNDAPKVNERENKLYLYDLQYNSDELDIIAVVAFKGEEEKRLENSLHWKSVVGKDGILFNREDVEMTVDPKSLYHEIEGRLTDEERVHDGVEYNGLKVVLRYDTIYKSIKSDGNALKDGRYYVHTFVMDGASDVQTFSLHLRTQNSANWYTLLIAVVLMLAVVLLAVALIIKGKLWQKKKK